MIPSTLRNIERAKKFFRDQDPAFDTGAQPVIACPMWFIDEVQELYGMDPKTNILDMIHGMKIIERPEISEPLFVLADGRWCQVIPTWARAIATNLQAVAIVDQKATEVTLPGRDDAAEASTIVTAHPAEAAVAKIASDSGA